MEDFESMPAFEMMARREAAEAETGRLLGQLVFAYSRFVTSLHLCAAWRNEGAHLDTYGATARGLGVFELLGMIENQARDRFGSESPAFKKYKAWIARAHKLREMRNILMHSRWGIEAYGSHAIAVSTTVFVEPEKAQVVNFAQLRALNETSALLSKELSDLRREHPL